MMRATIAAYTSKKTWAPEGRNQILSPTGLKEAFRSSGTIFKSTKNSLSEAAFFVKVDAIQY